MANVEEHSSNEEAKGGRPAEILHLGKPRNHGSSC